MKAVILAGGFGTRLGEETDVRPKPMVEIGGKPILWHILKIYSGYGVNDFIICCGYKGYLIKEYFANYHLHTSDITFDMATGEQTVHNSETEPWKVTLVDTGDDSMTGGRLKRVRKYLEDEPSFHMTYGDGVADVDIEALTQYHHQHDALATVTAIKPPGRFGSMDIKGDTVTGFREKPEGDGGEINGGFFVLSPDAIDYIDSDATVWEQEPLERLSRDGQLRAYHHHGFWQPMDTQRDKLLLNNLWRDGRAPWKSW